ncbi:MAG: hypothetical protein QOC77_3895 [Thermoleophilaceae bacterium]|jgi:hypothetical protein|nr:hypothetical protein [Thermoleophilaceae bacterium]MEA2471854.1 hypothetical protein [Thermoleophilaceae bacterium]
MGFKHVCSFCGWERLSATPVMLAPSCGHCGCALDAHAVERATEPIAGRAGAFTGWTTALRRVAVLFAMLALYAGTKLGYDAAGPSGALVAFGMGGFLLVPFVPQRFGALRR